MDRSRNRLKPGMRVVAIGYALQEPHGTVKYLYPRGVEVLLDSKETHIIPAHMLVEEKKDRILGSVENSGPCGFLHPGDL